MAERRVSGARAVAGEEVKATRQPFHDPYDAMSDAEFAAYVAGLRQGRRPQVPVGLRMPPELIASLKTEARRIGIPYQTYLKGILAARPRLPKAS
jgi:hypothetical protein